MIHTYVGIKDPLQMIQNESVDCVFCSSDENLSKLHLFFFELITELHSRELQASVAITVQGLVQRQLHEDLCQYSENYHSIHAGY